jgi:hypothetical protein
LFKSFLKKGDAFPEKILTPVENFQKSFQETVGSFKSLLKVAQTNA